MSAETAPASTTTTGEAVARTKKQVDFSEVSETVNRLASHKGVTAVLILNSNGDILTQTGKGLVGNPKLLAKMLHAATRYVQSIPNDDDDDNDNNNNEEEHADGNNQQNNHDPKEELSFVRIRSSREEILVAPKSNYVLVVLQDPNIASL